MQAKAKALPIQSSQATARGKGGWQGHALSSPPTGLALGDSQGGWGAGAGDRAPRGLDPQLPANLQLPANFQLPANPSRGVRGGSGRVTSGALFSPTSVMLGAADGLGVYEDDVSDK